MSSSRSWGTTAPWPARVLVVVLLAWVLIPLTAQRSDAFAGIVIAGAYGGRDLGSAASPANTIYSQASYPATPSANQGSVGGLTTLGAMSSTATADPLTDTASSTANSGGLSVAGVLSLAAASATCTATPSGATATVQASGLTLLGLPVNTVPAGNIPPNTTIQQTDLFGQNTGYITFNEQTYTTSGGQYYMVTNAVHVVNKTTAGVVTGNIELAHVECGTTAPITPVISSIAPNQGPGTGGTTVTVTGINLFAITSVTFGAANATSYAMNVSRTTLTAVAPAGTGIASIRITNVAGTSADTATDDFSYIPKPTVTAVNPVIGPTAGGTSAVITGTNLATATGVKFGANTATSFVVNSNTQITAVAPARSAGQIDITVTAVGGTSDAVTADQYTYVAPPTVTNVSPPTGPLTAGTNVTVTGTDFTGVTAVRFGATNAVSYTVNSATQLTAVAPAGSVGPVDVTVTAVGGASATGSADLYTYAAVPTVTAVVPSSGPTSAGTSVVITGTALTGATAVKFGTTAATGFTVNSATQITATAPAGTAGPADVTVTTPGGTSPVSAADQYTYVTAPAVTSISPTRGPLAGGTTVVITGTTLGGASAVRFGALNATSFVPNSPTQITAVAPAGAAGTVDVTVTTVGGTSATSSAGRFTYVAAPAVTNVSPPAGPIAGGTGVTVTGTDFTGATSVTFGGTAATSVTVSSDTQMVVTAPARTAGTVDIVVTAPGGVSATSSADQFTYYNAPTVTALSPASGPTTAGASVVVTGTGLTGATAVKFGAGTASSFVVTSSTQITAVAPSGSVGPVDVTVTTPGGISALTPADRYTYLAAPTVSAVSPGRGPLGGGNSVVIAGANLTGASVVRFGTSNAASFTVNSATQITAVAPAGSLGPVDVTVTTLGGTSPTSSAGQYSYVAAPTVTAVSPTTGSTTGGTTVTVTGTGFTGASSVSFGGTPATGVITVSSDTQITAVSPAHAAGPVDVTVTAPGGVSATSAADRFTFVAPPAVTGLNPSGGAAIGSLTQVVTITGTGFTGATSVTFDGYPTIQILSVTPTQIQIRGIPPHPTGQVHVQVTNPYGTSDAIPADLYTYQGLPTLTSISPASGPTAGGNTVVLTGTGFLTTTDVSFGANAATYTVNSDSQITATVPAGSAGAVNVVVSTLYGLTGGSSPLQYTYVVAPAVTSVSPVAGPVGGGTVVTINGTGFSGATGVSFGGVAATGVSVSSGSLITVFAPAQAAGPVDVTVTTVGGTSAVVAGDVYTYVAAPVVTAVAPSAGPVSGGTTVVVTGIGFTGASSVSFGSTAATSFTVDSGTRITAVAPAGTAGAVDVRVTTVGGTSGVVGGDVYTYVAAPTVTLVAPSAGPLAGGSTVVVTGTGFTGASAVSFGSGSATSYVVNSATQITAVAPPGSAGTVDVRVTAVGGTSAVVVADRFSYQAAPAITGLSPTHGPVGGGTLVSITGSSFTGATTVTFDGIAAAGVIAVSTDTLIIAQAPAHVAGPVSVVVTAPGGTSAAAGFLYVGTPVVSGLSPLNGPIAGGTSVVITGTGFTTGSGATAVQFGGTNASTYTVNSDTQITAVTPPHGAGAAGVTVTTADGGTSAPGTFTYIPVPTVTGISPAQGPEAGGISVIVGGTGFTTASSVRFDGNSASFTVDSDTRITAVAPAGTGRADVTVTTVGGASATGAVDRFRYVGTPTLTSVSPTSGPVAGGTSVTITGTQFYGVTGVSFGGVAATSYTVVGPTQITATTPAGSAGPVDVRVTTGDGGTSSAGTSFIYVADPVVASLLPAGGATGGGAVVVISGSGFSGATAVRFGSVPAASFTVSSGSQITAVSPAGAVGTVDVTVVGPYVTSATSSSDRFTYAAGPTLTGVTPSAGPLAGGTVVSIAGTGFTLTSTVTVGGNAATSVQYVSPAQLSAVVPAGSAGPADVVVATPYGQDSLTGGYVYCTAPSVSALTPDAGPESGGTVVTITGTGFTDATQVRFGSSVATFTVSTDTRITATAPAGTGSVDVTVTGPGGVSVLSVADRFRYAPVPVVTSLSPVFGPTAGGTTLTLTGTGLTDVSSLAVGGSSVSFTVVSDSVVTLVTPPGLPGNAAVVVTTAGGTSAPISFRYADAPSVSGLSPDAGPLGGGTAVTVTGTDFAPGSTVTFGGVAAVVQYVSPTQLIADSPARGSAGAVNVVVATAYGTSATGNLFTYKVSPTFSGVSPGAGPEAGGTLVTVDGSGFTGASNVSFGGVAGTGLTVSSDTRITVFAPAGSGIVDVVVTAPGGVSAVSVAGRYRYAPVPVVTRVNPSSGPLSGGTSFTVTGSGFSAATDVTVDGVSVGFSLVDGSTLTLTTPSHAAGSVPVVVVTPGGTSAPVTFTYVNAPTVTALTPDAGPLSGGTAVTVSGTGFTLASTVAFGGAAAASVQFISPSQLIAVLPVRGSAGGVNVVVTTAYGSSGPGNTFTYTDAPTISSVSPGAGPLSGGTTVTLAGSGLTGASGVTFDGVAAVSYTVNSDASITAVAPAGSPGNAVVRVTTVGGSSTGVFRYANVPIVSGVSPVAGPEAGGTLVTVDGSGFFGATVVRFGAVAASGFTVSSDSRISVFAPPGTGTVDVVVTAPGGVSASSSADRYRYAPVPSIGTAAPDTGPLAGGTVVTLSGSGFIGTTGLTIGGVPVVFTVLNDSTITFTTPPGSAGSADIVVTTPGGVSAPVMFTYADIPSVHGVSPDEGPIAGGAIVTITGTGFGGATAVAFGGVPATGFAVMSPTQITATSPAQAVGVVDVRVTGPGGTTATSSGDRFTYRAVPVIGALSPSSGPVTGGTPVTLSGSGFDGATSVRVGGVAVPFSVADDFTIAFTTPAGTGAAAVIISTAGGSAGSIFTFAAAPTVTALAPAAGPLSGGTSVTIDGTGFTLASTVAFGAQPAASVQFVGPTRLVAAAPAVPSASTVSVVVTTAYGNSGAVSDFIYTDVPVITGVQPASGPLNGGNTVVISGFDFNSATGVSFGPVAAVSYSVISDTEISAVAPAQGAGPVDVLISGTGGTSPITIGGRYLYLAVPVVSSLAPDAGPTAGGTGVTITGTGFTNSSQVTFDGTPAGSVQFVSATELVATSPAHPAGIVDVVVTTAGGSSLLGGAFEYQVAPVLSGVAPSSGPLAGGTTVTLSGSGFTPASTVRFGSLPASVQYVSANRLDVVSPAGSAGAVNVVVTTAGGDSAPEIFSYLDIPGISSVTPASGPLAGGSVVTVRGSGFTGATALRFGALSATNWTVSNDTTITAVVPTATTGGPVNVTVTAPGGPTPATSTSTYAYVAAPVLTGVTRVSGPVTGGTSVTIRGAGLTGATKVLIGGVAVTFTVQDDTTITAVTPPGSSGAADVVVTTVGGDSAPGTFTYVPVPLIVTLSPDAGPTAGGTTLTINGSGLAGGTVTVDGASVTPDSVTDSSIILRTPAHPAGTVTVRVATAGGAADSQFTYVAPQSTPVLSSVDPASGPEAGGNTVTLTGVGFTGATEVKFGAGPASFTVVDDSTVTAVVPAGIAGAVLVSVTTPNGTTGGTVSYSYVEPPVAPTVTGVTPAFGPVAGGTPITITGTGFDADTTVTFDGVPGSGVVVGASTTRLFRALPSGIRAASSTSLTVLTPAHAEGPAAVTVTNTAGSADAEIDFTYVPPLLEATISLEVEVNAATAVAPQGSLSAGLKVLACSIPNRGASSVAASAAFCRYTAPDQAGTDAFTMQITDAIGQTATQAVRITVVENDPGGQGTGGGGGNDGGGTGSGGGGGNDNSGGSGSGKPGSGGGSGSGGGGGNDTPGRGDPTIGVPTPTTSPVSPVPTTSPVPEAATPSPTPAPTVFNGALPKSLLIPLIIGIGALLVAVLAASTWYLWWPWLLLLLARRRRRKNDD
ncbi:beta strand repeat-containing protein [Kineosporia mesophila]|uniref:beta strand repeat-containing protein n=1 Tax=Kineosporia mesophila TaxID=566012 RepID=UPI0031EFA200